MDAVIGLDVGTKTIGVARAWLRGGIATPVTTVRRRGVARDCARLAEICRKEQAAAVVVGIALEADGGEGRSARLARQVGDALGALTELPVHYQDETLSTVEASQRLADQGLDTRAQRKRIDQAAAAVILEDWLNENSSS